MKATWEIKRLGEVCKTVQDGAHRSPQRLHATPGPGRFLYITSKNIRTNYLDLGNVSYTERDFHDEIYARCRPALGDVLLTKDGANTGNVALNTIDEPFSLLSSVCLIKTDQTVLNPGFLCYYIQSPAGLSSIVGEMTGAAIRRIVLRDIKVARIPIPPLSEQQRIVNILDKTFDGIATAKANAEKNLQNARALFQLYSEGVFANHGEGWIQAKLGHVADVQSGGTPLVSRKDYWGGRIPWYSSGELNDLLTADPKRHVTALGLDSSNAKLFPKGSLLIGMYDTAALKMAILDREGAFNQAIAGVRPNDEIEMEFVFHATNAIKPLLLLERRGVRQKNLSLEKIKN